MPLFGLRCIPKRVIFGVACGLLFVASATSKKAGARACLTSGCAYVIPCGKGDHGGRGAHGQTRRGHRQSLAADGAALAGVRSERGAVAQPSNRRQRHPLEAENRIALARPAGEVRPLADLLRPIQPLETRRHLRTWDRLLAQAQTESDAVGEVEWEVEWEVSVDDTVIRAHQHAAGARREPSARDEKGGS